MAEKDPPRVKFIEVKPAADVTDDDCNILTTQKGNNYNAVEKIKGSQNKSNFFSVPPQIMSVREAQFAENDRSFQEVELTFEKQVTDLSKEEKVCGIKEEKEKDIKPNEKFDESRKAKNKKRKLKKNSVLPLNVTKLDKEKFENSPGKEVDLGVPDCRNDKTKKTKKKKDKTKKKKKGQDESVLVTQSTSAQKEQEQKTEAIDVTAKKNSSEDKPADDKKARKLPCCFGFIATWLAKRKQTRRDKKKRAIANRSGQQCLVQHEHKKARGGEAFVIEVDTKPVMKKPLLPPIKQKAGPIRHGTDRRLQTAGKRRAKELAKRKAGAVTYESKRSKCKARKTEMDIDFRNRTDLTIRSKQADAERNRYNLSRRTVTTTRPVASIQSSSCESMSIEGDPRAFIGDDSDLFAFQDNDSDAEAWRVDDVDIFSY